MTAYCEIGLPVPLDSALTYAVRESQHPQRGARVIVPFREEKLVGVCTKTDVPEPTEFKVRHIESVLDEEPILDELQMNLAEWIASYYIAPIGEVLRSMLPLTAEVHRSVVFRITDLGREKLAERTAQTSLLTSGEPNMEISILRFLSGRDCAKITAIRAAIGASAAEIKPLVSRKWISRETLAEEHDARRVERFAALTNGSHPAKLTPTQQAVLDHLASHGGELPVSKISDAPISAASLKTLVKRKLIRIDDRPAQFRLGGMKPAKTKFDLNPAQSSALQSITAGFGVFKPFLLHGITGSGKTAVYLSAMQQALDRGMSALMLVPEISLTPQMVGLLDAVFGGKVALLHSALSAKERCDQWHRIRDGVAPIVVGTRSAIFAPVPNLGLIVVDEEHDHSYKQEENPRYNGRDVAVYRAKLANCTIVLGSATPSLESWHNAEEGRYTKIDMHERVMSRPLPEVELVDMRKEFQETGSESIFSRSLLEQIQATLDRDEQVLILLNRRGYSFSVMCRKCGQKLECDNCAISLTYHKSPVEEGGSRVRKGQRLECHYCGQTRVVPDVCPKCQSEYLYYFGAGSEQAEERLGSLFPKARIGRMDRDTVSTRTKLEHLLARLHAGEINLMVGTQMLAKGHDIHGVTLVGVVGCDHALSLPDFRAAERVFQLITQVSGRAGRGESPGRVVVQSYYPEHYSIQAARSHDFERFATFERKYRSSMRYPPFSVLANVLVQSENLEDVMTWSAHLGNWLSKRPHEAVRSMGPCAAPLARLKGVHRFHFIIRSDSRSALNQVLRSLIAVAEAHKIPRGNLVVDVDAQNLM
jgi:primosomal protein N' (replication factor Y) (superfamily II helicase)